jgi:TetR/AcrR family transcriptional regulator, fatty acid metabolism regulator protein
VSPLRDRDRPTFTEEARRRQIVAAALETIASQGYSQTSIGEIAKQLEVSKGVISYHFASKQELITDLINSILAAQNSAIRTSVEAAEGAPARLRAYITASFAHMAANRSATVALVDLWGSFTSPEARRAFSATAYDPCRAHLMKILRLGQEQGVFGDFDPNVLATTIQAAIDGVMLQWVFDATAVDLDRCAAELAALFGERVGRKE